MSNIKNSVGSIAAHFGWLAFSCTLILGIGMIAMGISETAPFGADPNTSIAGGLVIITLALWIAGVVPEFFTSLLFLFAASVLAVAPPEKIFAGFYSSAMWLIFGGLILGHAVLVTAIGKQIVSRVLSVSPPGYLGVLAMVALSGLCLAFVVPTAIGRVALMAPIAVQLANQIGFAEGSKGRTGLVMTASMSTSLPAFAILPSNVPNLVMSATADSIYGVQFSYGQYLAINFPVLGLLSVFAIVGSNWLLFREEMTKPELPKSPERLSGPEYRLAVVLCLTVLLWVTDAWHGISAAWVAMGAALVVTAPVIGTIPLRDLTDKINFAPMFFVAGVVGFGAVVSDAGLSDWAGNRLLVLLDLINLSGDAATYAALTTIGIGVATATTVPTAPPIMTPLAAQLSEATGWSLDAVLLAQVPTWIIIPFPYLVPPLLFSMSVGRIPSRHALKLLFAYFLTGIVFIAPAHFMWGRFLGVFG